MKKIPFSYQLVGGVIKTLCYVGINLRLLRIYGEENIPHCPQGQMFVSNHPSKLVQPLLLLGLFKKYFDSDPLKYVPRIAADINNFVNHPVSRLLGIQEWFIPVNRDRPTADQSLVVAQQVAENNLNQLWFPGGTRDWKATKTVTSTNGKKIGVFKKGFAVIATKNQMPVTPIWYERVGLVVYIVVGTPIRLKTSDPIFICRVVEAEILSLADTVP